MIKNFVQWYIKTNSIKKGRKLIGLDDVKDMIYKTPRGYSQSIKAETGLLEEDFVLCFANSKFIVIDEMVSID